MEKGTPINHQDKCQRGRTKKGEKAEMVRGQDKCHCGVLATKKNKPWLFIVAAEGQEKGEADKKRKKGRRGRKNLEAGFGRTFHMAEGLGGDGRGPKLEVRLWEPYGRRKRSGLRRAQRSVPKTSG